MDDNLQQHLDNLMTKGNTSNLKIIEYGIDFQVVMEYWRLMRQHKEKLSDEVRNAQSKELYQLPKEEQKVLLTHLGRSGVVADYRLLEDFMENVDSEEMKKWAIVALQHCRIHIENDLLDDPIGFIATGLGGKGSKIRYYFVLIATEELRPVMVSEIEASYQEIVGGFDAEIEEVRQLNDYIIVKILCPLNVRLAKIIEIGKENYPFLSDDYIATNMITPDEEMIKDWIANKKKSSMDIAEALKNLEFDDDDDFLDFDDDDNFDDDDDDGDNDFRL